MSKKAKYRVFTEFNGYGDVKHFRRRRNAHAFAKRANRAGADWVTLQRRKKR